MGPCLYEDKIETLGREALPRKDVQTWHFNKINLYCVQQRWNKQQSRLFISTAKMLWNRFGRVWFAVVPLIGFSLLCFSSNVPVYVVREVSCLLWAQSEALWECFCLMRLMCCLMTENYSDDSSSLSDRVSFLLRNYIVEFEVLSLRSGWSEGSRLLFSSAEYFNSCLLCLSRKWGF